MVLYIKGGKISTTSGLETSAIYNGIGTVNVEGGEVSKIGGGRVYGIYNASTGTINVKEGKVNCSSSDYACRAVGIYNASTGIVNVFGGEVITSSTIYQSGGI